MYLLQKKKKKKKKKKTQTTRQPWNALKCDTFTVTVNYLKDKKVLNFPFHAVPWP